MGNLRPAIWGALLGTCLLGCATVPVARPEETARARQLAVPEGKALVYVYRGSGLGNAMNTFTLYANEQPVGEIASGTFYVLETAPGDLRLDFPYNNGAASLKLKVEAGRRYYVSQWIEVTYLLLVSVHKARLTQVDEEEGASSLGSLVRVVQLTPHQDEDRLARERQAPPDRALVYAFRSLWAAPGLEVEIVVNGQVVGKEAPRSFVVTEVAPGPVSVNAKAENQATLLLDLQPGSTVYLEVVPKMGLMGPSVELRQVSEARGRMALAGLRLAAQAQLASTAGAGSGSRPP